MKYNELERRLLKFGCYPTGEQQRGHPIWYSPKTGNHKSQKVATGTLNKILREAGLK